MSDLGGGSLDSSQAGVWRTDNYHSIAALVVVVWDILTTLDDEVELIWSKSRFSPIKWLFVFIRYFSPAVAICDQLITREIANMHPHATHLCRPWYAFQATSVQVLQCAVDIVLMIRVHALYHRNNRIAILLFVLFVAEIITFVVCAVLTVTRLDFDSVCILNTTPHTYIPTAFESLGTQVIILVLAVYRHICIVRETPAKSPLISLMIRDGMLIFTTVIGLLVFLSITILANNTSVGVAHPWFISILSSAGCKVILNMQHLAIEESKENRNDPSIANFTTDFIGLETDPDTYTLTSLAVPHLRKPTAW